MCPSICLTTSTSYLKSITLRIVATILAPSRNNYASKIDPNPSYSLKSIIRTISIPITQFSIIHSSSLFYKIETCCIIFTYTT